MATNLEKAIVLAEQYIKRSEELYAEIVKLRKENAELKEEIETMKDQRELESMAMKEAAWYDN